MTTELPDIIARHIEPIPESGCWLWIGARFHRGGYGQIKRRPMTFYAHRYIYEMLLGPVAPELELDHVCRVRACVNPDHLEQVTHEENMRRARRTHCQRGHPMMLTGQLAPRRRCLPCEYMRRASS